MTDDDDTTADPYPERMWLDLPPDTLKRIDAVLAEGETREDFVRTAVRTALAQQERERGT